MAGIGRRTICVQVFRSFGSAIFVVQAFGETPEAASEALERCVRNIQFPDISAKESRVLRHFRRLARSILCGPALAGVRFAYNCSEASDSPYSLFRPSEKRQRPLQKLQSAASAIFNSRTSPQRRRVSRLISRPEAFGRSSDWCASRLGSASGGFETEN